jgi:hypothetical protein
MTEKTTFVDVIQDRTRQFWRRPLTRPTKGADEDKPRVGRWPPPLRAAWRLELLKPWKDKD